MTQAVAKAQGNPTLLTIMKNFEGEYSKALPKHLASEQFIRYAMTTVKQSPKLQKCDPYSVAGSVMAAAELGLRVGVLGEAHLVPYKDKAQLIIGFEGMIQLARNSGQVSDVQAHVVREGDTFEYELGTVPTIIHKPALNGDGKIIAAYSVVTMKGGTVSFRVVDRKEIDRTRKRSRAGGDGPWETDFDKMAMKTAIRRHFKYLPRSTEMGMAIGLEDRLEAGKDQDGRSFLPNAPERDEAIEVEWETEEEEQAQEEPKEPSQNQTAKVKDKIKKNAAGREDSNSEPQQSTEADEANDGEAEQHPSPGGKLPLDEPPEIPWEEKIYDEIGMRMHELTYGPDMHKACVKQLCERFDVESPVNVPAKKRDACLKWVRGWK